MAVDFNKGSVNAEQVELLAAQRMALRQSMRVPAVHTDATSEQHIDHDVEAEAVAESTISKQVAQAEADELARLSKNRYQAPAPRRAETVDMGLGY